MEVLQPSAQKPVGAGGSELTPCLLEAFQMREIGLDASKGLKTHVCASEVCVTAVQRQSHGLLFFP